MFLSSTTTSKEQIFPPLFIHFFAHDISSCQVLGISLLKGLVIQHQWNVEQFGKSVELIQVCDHMICNHIFVTKPLT